jgi:L-threonylcarbamoyladenylate synthase
VSPEVQRAAEILERGGLVAFPTETVYGLGADASSKEAVARLYAAKRRPADHPVIVHFASRKSLRVGADIPPAARRLAERFWQAAHHDPQALEARAGLRDRRDTVGLRVPSHPSPMKCFLFWFWRGSTERQSLHRVADHRRPCARTRRRGRPGARRRSSDVGIESTIVLSGGGACCGPASARKTSKIVSSVTRKSPHSGGLERHYVPRTPGAWCPRTP